MGSGESAAFLAAAPRTHRRFNVYFLFTTLDDGPVRRGGPPNIPQNPFPPLAVEFEFRVFPDSLKHKKALQGLGTASGGRGS